MKNNCTYEEYHKLSVFSVKVQQLKKIKQCETKIVDESLFY